MSFALLLALLLAASDSLSQTTYYVASTGSDTNDGRSLTSPVQSLSRVNGFVLQPGDKVLFRRGDTFRGTLSIRQSGTAEQLIEFDAYASGPKPVLAGSMPVRNWTRAGSNVWQAYCPACGNSVTGLYRNGLALPLGRYPNPDAPNSGSLPVQAHVGASQVTSGQPLTTDWTGADVVLRPTYWIIDRATIRWQQGNTLTLDNRSTYQLTDGWGFFIQNHPATLDQSGEWYYDPDTQLVQLYVDKGNPNEQLITATAVERAVDIANAAFIRMQNLRITQARSTNLFAYNTENLVLSNDELTDAGEDGLDIQGSGSDLLIENSTIANCNNNGVRIGAYQNVTFRTNAIRRVGLLPGRGKSGDGQFTAFQSFAIQNTLIENNVIDSVGYIGLSVQDSATIRQNLISHFCMTKSDGGGIYLWNGGELPMTAIRIQSNIIRNGVGTTGGLLDSTVSGAHGIFLDDCVQGVELTDNTITNCQGLGIYLHAVSNVRVTGNTCFNNSVSQLVLYNYEKTCQPRNNTISRNLLIAKTADQPVAGYISSTNDLAYFGVMARNYYARPFNDLSTIQAVYNRNVVGNLNLSQWQTQFGQDLTSRSSPITYKDYAVKSLAMANQIDAFIDGNADGWETWSPYNNGRVSWHKGSQPTEGRLTISFSHVSGRTDSYVLAYRSILAVTRSKRYLVRFNAASPVDRKAVVFIRQRQAPYADLTRRYEFMAGSTPTPHEFAFTISADEADALLTFQLGEDGQPVWLDNIRLQEAVVDPINPDAFIRLVYNPTMKDSLVVLNEAYRDVRNHYYVRQVRLKPYTSVVLLRDSLPPVDVSLSLQATHTSLIVGEVTSLSLTVHNGSVSPAARSGPVQWSCQLPASLTLVNGNGVSPTVEDSLLSGTVQRLITDTTFVFQLQAMATGSYRLAAQVTATTYADPDSTPGSGTDDGEDDQTGLTLLVREPSSVETVRPAIVTATELAESGIEKSLIYPNPTVDEFTFVAEDDVLTLQVIDELGRERYRRDTIRRGQEIRFGQSLPDAYYVLAIQYKTGEQRTVKLMKSGK